MELVNANIEDSHHLSKLEVGSNRSDTAEEKFPRLTKLERSEIGVKEEEDSNSYFKSVTENGVREGPGGKIMESGNGESAEKQAGGDTSEPQY